MADQVLVTGAAGFIGFHVARRLLAEGRSVVGIDNMNVYYDSRLKEARRAELAKFPAFQFRKLDLVDRDAVASLFGDIGLWREYAAAVLGASQCRSSDQPVCRHQEGERGDGARL
jgi:nucleoside-diphosphate-sugar epimerase